MLDWESSVQKHSESILTKFIIFLVFITKICILIMIIWKNFLK